jgi:hypothetical protein
MRHTGIVRSTPEPKFRGICAGWILARYSTQPDMRMEVSLDASAVCSVVAMTDGQDKAAESPQVVPTWQRHARKPSHPDARAPATTRTGAISTSRQPELFIGTRACNGELSPARTLLHEAAHGRVGL